MERELGISSGEIKPFNPAGELSNLPPKSSRSHSSPIENLPFDILYEIVLYIVSEDWETGVRTNAPLYLSHTCRSLRTFSLNAPILWSHIYFDRPRPRFPGFSGQSLWLQRSRGSMLHISIQKKPKLGFSKKGLSSIMRLILPHVGRWESFQVTELRLKSYQVVFDRLRQACPPKLEILAAQIPRNDTKWKLAHFADGAPKLRSLITGTQVAMELAGGSNRVWPGLRRLEIHHLWESEPRLPRVAGQSRPLFHLSQLLEILRLHGGLEELLVEWHGMSIPRQYPYSSALVHVPNLRRLDVPSDGWDGKTLRQAIMMNVYAPQLMDTAKDLSLTSPIISALLSHSIFPLPRLQSVTLEKDASEHPSATQALAKFLELRSLTCDLLAPGLIHAFHRLLTTSLPCLQEFNIRYLQDEHDMGIIQSIAQARQDDPTLAALVKLQMALQERVRINESYCSWFEIHIPQLNIRYNADLWAPPTPTSPFLVPSSPRPQPPINRDGVLATGIPVSEGPTEDAPEADSTRNPSNSRVRRRYRKARKERNARKAARIAAGLEAVRSPPGRATYARERRVPWRPPRTLTADKDPTSEVSGLEQ